MMKFSVQITETTVTLIEVEAANSTDARAKIKRYGAIAAVSDFPVLDKNVRVAVGFAVLR